MDPHTEVSVQWGMGEKGGGGVGEEGGKLRKDVVKKVEAVQELNNRRAHRGVTELREREVKPKGDGGGSGLQDGFHKPMKGVKKRKLPSNEEQRHEERHPHYYPEHVWFLSPCIVCSRGIITIGREKI